VKRRLVCVSNRISLPERGAPPGGLAVGILSALRHTGGLWFGWSGDTTDTPPMKPEVLVRDNIRFATIDLRASEFDAYYNGYANGTIWPLFHYFTGLFQHEQAHHDAYEAVNATFARQLSKLLKADDAVWVHDYQLMPMARQLRALDFRGPIGFFLHIPFPHIQVLRALPNYQGLVRDLCDYDLVGFQTEDDVASFRSAVRRVLPSAVWSDDSVEIDGRSVKFGAFPIGIDVEQVALTSSQAMGDESMQRMAESLHGRKLIIGIDRLDYSKGLTERFAAFEQCLVTFPENRGQVTFLQVTPLSRTDVHAYTEIRATLEQMAGRVNGRFAEADWTPIRYLNRNFSHATSLAFLRAAKVAFVTPVRDGMNLVAKEFVAAQDPEDPGVLVLSEMAGAARELSGALQVNPYDKVGMAIALHTALHMPLEERKQRHQQMMAAVRERDIHRWYADFFLALTGEPIGAPEPRIVPLRPRRLQTFLTSARRLAQRITGSK
jgi:trehalose 6-phosphate synthase